MSDRTKARKLYLHIGGEETGATAMQLFAGANRAALRRHGVLYPASKGGQVHAGLPMYASALTRNDRVSRLYDFDGVDGIAGFRQKFADNLRAQVARSRCHTVFLSNERLSSAVRRPDEIRRLADLAGTLAEEVQVVMYVRDQADLFQSAWSNAIKAGVATDLQPPRSARRYYYNYQMILDNWAAQFGQAAMVVRVLDDHDLKDGFAVRDFINIIGLPDVTSWKFICNDKVRLDASAMQFLSRFNRSVGRTDGEGRNADRGQIVRALAEQSVGCAFTIAPEISDAIRDLFAESNANVARRYLGRADGVLFRQPAQHSAPMEELTVRQAVDIAARVWVWQQRYDRMSAPKAERQIGATQQEHPDEVGSGLALVSDRPKARILYLHIGGEKTGTTTLQLFAGANRAALRRLGVLYPEHNGLRVHAGLPMYASALTRNHMASRLYDFDGPGGIAGFRRRFAEDLRAQVAASSCHTIWLSNERLSSAVRRPGEIRRLVELARSLADEVKVVMYLRDQPDLFQSAYSNAIKAGLRQDLPPPRSSKEYYYNYERILDNWAAQFGPEAMIVRIYDRSELKNGDIVSDFLSVIQVPGMAGMKRISNKNIRLDTLSMQFLKLFNQTVGRTDGDILNPDRGRIVTALLEQSVGSRFTISLESASAIRGLFAESNANVARRYLGRGDGALFGKLRHDATPMEELTVQQAVDIAARVWVWQQRHNRIAARKTEHAGGDLEQEYLDGADVD